MKKMRTRLLSLLLVLVTVLSLLPTSALAASSTGTGIKPTSNTNYWTTRLLHDGTPYSYKPPMAAGKMLYCMDRGYGYRWGTPSFLNSYTYGKNAAGGVTLTRSTWPVSHQSKIRTIPVHRLSQRINRKCAVQEPPI